MVVDLTYPKDNFSLERNTPNLPPLSKEDMARAQELAQSLRRDDAHLDDIVTFGNKAQAALAQVSRDMLAGVRVGTLDEIIALSDGVITDLQSLNMLELSSAAHKVLFIFNETTAMIRHRVENFFRQWEMVNTRLDRQEANIFAKETEATERYHQDAQLARANYEILREAYIMLMAIKIFLDSEHGWAELERRKILADREAAAAARDNRAIDFTIMIARDRYATYIERLEAKGTSLTKMLVSAYQAHHAIDLMARNENDIRQKLSDIRTDLLPGWRMNIALAYQAYAQHGITRFVRELEDAEAEIRILAADQIEHAARGMYELRTRPFNFAAVKYFNDKLISALEIMKETSIVAKQERDKAEALSKILIQELGETVARSGADADARGGATKDQ